MHIQKTMLFNGHKATPIHRLPDEALTYVVGGPEHDKGLLKLAARVAWLYRGVELRANAVAAMPYEIKQGDEALVKWNGSAFATKPPDSLAWVIDLAQLLAKTEAAAVLTGRAYWEAIENMTATRAAAFSWLLPHTIEPKFDGESGDVTSWKRSFPNTTRPPRMLEPEQVIYFWPPDHTVEVGPAKVYPGGSVMKNAGVVGSMDEFLTSYFDRGMVKATLLSYKERLSDPEAAQVKEWWRRVATGIRNAFATQVVRGDFDTLQIGDGIGDMRDNSTLDKERESIAAGLGVPQSKLAANAANFATKQSDDRMMIEDTIIPEIGWIFTALNQQVLWPQGLNIVAMPQELAVMQEDENKRAQAYRALVGSEGGMTPREAEATLGIHVPDDARPVAEQDDAPAEVEAEKIFLNGAQIAAALQIQSAQATGDLPRENAINMYNAFLGIPPEIGETLIPPDAEEEEEPAAPSPALPPAFVANQLPPADEDDAEEEKRFKIVKDYELAEDCRKFVRWVSNRGDAGVYVDEFSSKHLTRDDKIALAFAVIQNGQAKGRADDIADAYTDKLVEYIEGALERGERPNAFEDGLLAIVREEMTATFREGAGLGEDAELDTDQREALDELIKLQAEAVAGFVSRPDRSRHR